MCAAADYVWDLGEKAVRDCDSARYCCTKKGLNTKTIFSFRLPPEIILPTALPGDVLTES
jgi:hypothetical protein